MLAISVLILGGDDPANRRMADQSALKPLGDLVGSWRGVGMVQRNQRNGAWKESADWAWKLAEDSAALRLQITDGKYLKSAVVRPGSTAGDFECVAVLADDTRRTFQGRFNNRHQLILASEEKAGGGPSRLTISPLHETRFLLLMEAAEGPRQFRRLGEVGFTREGVAFAAGESGPVCIVTGGRGTIAVKYKGETFHVCCSGCKQLFDEAPEKIIEQYRAKKP